jgi:ABC-type transporter Mla maintaining outer membrane lipid asymmetry ATPase subunit MlaF
VLLADEPFDGLDAPSVAATEALLAHLNGLGKTIVLVNHEIAQSLRIANRVVVLRHGRVSVDALARALDPAAVLAEVGGA